MKKAPVPVPPAAAPRPAAVPAPAPAPGAAKPNPVAALFAKPRPAAPAPAAAPAAIAVATPILEGSPVWQKYISGCLWCKQMKNGSWVKNVCEHAAIIDHKGNVLANTKGFTLGKYVYDMQVDEKNVQKVPVDEKQLLINVVLNGTTDENVGVRVNNEKHVMVNYDPVKKLTYFSKRDGGACAMATNTVIIYASYNQNLVMSDGMAQGPGLCNAVVENTADMLLKNKA